LKSPNNPKQTNYMSTNIKPFQIFAFVVAVLLATYSIFLLGKMAAGGNVSAGEINLLALTLIINSLCTFTSLK
jgi:hypothetical protein